MAAMPSPTGRHTSRNDATHSGLAPGLMLQIFTSPVDDAEKSRPLLTWSDVTFPVWPETVSARRKSALQGVVLGHVPHLDCPVARACVECAAVNCKRAHPVLVRILKRLPQYGPPVARNVQHRDAVVCRGHKELLANHRHTR